ncbi:nucleoside diphosphate kinase [Anaeromyces robustus]|uniref:Nucleoside diphosphate kinase n=1 Tax=Anaeromyces robustus TaxID=1754192 RepID=A0A1Y1XR56_9FUNG|nr:nucleoside diphosphate kinase [Anaeromyces robustus]|eukprot:ORX88230.1 nucleoside diphosphate kinase [Anaeromyces robustus]
MATERTYIMVKPDGVARGLVGEIIKRFENKGFKLIAIKMLQADEQLITKHYEEHIGKPFFPKIVKYILSGPVVGMVWQGKGVVAYGRVMLGKTDPLKSEPGTIRGDFGIDSGRNVVHGSDSVESAEREIKLWFPEGVVEYTRALDDIIYE